MEDPQALAGADVERTHIAFLVSPALRHAAGQMRGADDNHVFGDGRGGVQTNLTGDQVHVLIVVQLQIDDAALAEAGHGNSCLRVERDKTISRRHVDHPRLSGVGPVSQPATGESARGRIAARPLVFAVHPQQFASCGVERHDRSPRARRRIDNAVRHQGRRFIIEFRTGAQRIGLEAPRHLQLVEVVLIDLVERRVLGVGEVTAPGSPFAGLRASLPGKTSGRDGEHDCEDCERQAEQSNPSRHD